jgi:hypothetical protein
MADNPRSWREVGRVFLLIILAVVLAVCYNALDRNGWIPHTERAVIIYPKQGWEVGEYNNCKAQRDESAANSILVDCFISPDDWGAARELDVRFWGKVGNESTSFKCKRNEDSISCHYR